MENDLELLLNEFAEKVAQEESSESLEPKLASKRMTAKQLRMQLEKDKAAYMKARMALESHEAAHADMASVIDREKEDVKRNRANIMKGYEVLRNMDLHDIQEVRYINDDVGYVRKNRIFVPDENDVLVPFHRKKRKEEEPDSVFVDDIDDYDSLDADADSLLESLID
jgi:hypothetical protein